MNQRWKSTKEPDLQLAGFSLWVFGRQYESAHDYWDGNWLNVCAQVEADSATVKASGAILHLSELAGFLNELKRLDDNLKGDARLSCIEPNLGIVIRGESLGQMTTTINITPNHMTQRHEFVFAIDQSYLKPLIASCRSIIAQYPIRGNPDPPS